MNNPNQVHPVPAAAGATPPPVPGRVLHAWPAPPPPVPNPVNVHAVPPTGQPAQQALPPGNLQGPPGQPYPQVPPPGQTGPLPPAPSPIPGVGTPGPGQAPIHGPDATQPPGSTPAHPNTPSADPASTTTNTHGRLLPPEEGHDVKDEPENITQQEKEHDYSGEYGKKVYCQRHRRSMLPLILIFTSAGRFPFSSTMHSDGTYEYKFSVFHLASIHFMLVTVIMILVMSMGMWGFLHVSLNVSISEKENDQVYQWQREYENVLIQRHYMPLIYVYASLIHGCFAAIMMIKKRHYMAHYFTFWSKAVYTMHMDISRVGRNFTFEVLLVFILTVGALTQFAVHKIGPTSIGLPTIFGDLTLRWFPALPFENGWMYSQVSARRVVQSVGGVILIFIFTGSKSTILLFIYHCKLLQSALAYWNGRVYAAVLRGGEFAQTEEGRTTYKLLFKDHCILLDLMEGLDHSFAHSLESYFGCQVFSLFFELYFVIRTAKHGDDRAGAAYPGKNESAFFIRPFDWLPGLVMLFLSIIVIYSASKSAANVAEEAMAGMEVLRRRTMLGRKTDDELYFILSMFSSYTAYKKLEISGGGYSYFNKDFLIGVLSAVLSYLIILYQFQPAMDQPFDGNSERADRIKFGRFLAEVEGLEKAHYETTEKPLCVWNRFKLTPLPVPHAYLKLCPTVKMLQN